MLNWIRKLFRNKGSYHRKCEGENHYGKVMTPTLSRRVISIDGPCECGYYKSHRDFMDKQFIKLEEIINGPKN